MNTLDRMAAVIKERGDNVFDMALWQKGERSAHIITRTAPCQNCYSVTKSFTSIAVGIAQDRGLLSVDDPILKYLRGELPGKYDEKLERVTIKHLLTQTMGNEKGYLFEGDRYTHGSDDFLYIVLSAHLKYEPGTRFCYSNSTYYLLSCIVRRASGMMLDEFARQNIFVPLGVKDYAWTTCPKGETSGATGLYLPTGDLLKFGVMLMNKGIYEGRRVVSEEYIAEATKNHITFEEKGNYGYSFVPVEGGFTACGAYNQQIIVLPDKGIVFAAHAFMENINYYELLMDALD